jgi:hypothetical protein
MRLGEKRRVIVFHTEKHLAGSVLVTGGQPEAATVKLEPWGEATGRLVDDAGQPVKDGHQTAVTDEACYTDFAQGASPLCPTRGNEAVAPDARFRFSGLAPGLKYRFHFHTTKAFREHATATLEVVAKSGEVKDVGDVRLVAPKPQDDAP